MRVDVLHARRSDDSVAAKAIGHDLRHLAHHFTSDFERGPVEWVRKWSSGKESMHLRQSLSLRGMLAVQREAYGKRVAKWARERRRTAWTEVLDAYESLDSTPTPCKSEGGCPDACNACSVSGGPRAREQAHRQ